MRGEVDAGRRARVARRAPARYAVERPARPAARAPCARSRPPAPCRPRAGAASSRPGGVARERRSRRGRPDARWATSVRARRAPPTASSPWACQAASSSSAGPELLRPGRVDEHEARPSGRPSTSTTSRGTSSSHSCATTSPRSAAGHRLGSAAVHPAHAASRPVGRAAARRPRRPRRAPATSGGQGGEDAVEQLAAAGADVDEVERRRSAEPCVDLEQQRRDAPWKHRADVHRGAEVRARPGVARGRRRSRRRAVRRPRPGTRPRLRAARVGRCVLPRAHASALVRLAAPVRYPVRGDRNDPEGLDVTEPAPPAHGEAPPRLRVGVVGTGRAGAVLGAALARCGHPWWRRTPSRTSRGCAPRRCSRACRCVPVERGRRRRRPRAAHRARRRAARARRGARRHRSRAGRAVPRARQRSLRLRRARPRDARRCAAPRAAPGDDLHRHEHRPHPADRCARSASPRPTSCVPSPRRSWWRWAASRCGSRSATARSTTRRSRTAPTTSSRSSRRPLDLLSSAGVDAARAARRPAAVRRARQRAALRRPGAHRARSRAATRAPSPRTCASSGASRPEARAAYVALARVTADRALAAGLLKPDAAEALLDVLARTEEELR